MIDILFIAVALLVTVVIAAVQFSNDSVDGIGDDARAAASRG